MRRLALLLPAACSALAVHALVLGLHGYFAWYEPAVAGLAVAGLCVFVAAGRRLRVTAPEPHALAAATLGVLFVQESVEAGRVLAFAPSQLLLLVVAVAAVSWLVAAALRVVRVVLVPAARIAVGALPGWTVRRAEAWPSHPLGRFRALRAPPPLAA